MPIFKKTFPYIYSRDKNNVKSEFNVSNELYRF